MVAIHGVVAADDVGYGADRACGTDGRHGRQRLAGAPGRGISSVEKSVHTDVRRTAIGCHSHHRRDLPLVAKHAARRHQTEG